MRIALTLAWRYLWGRKLRTVLTTLAVVFGVAVLFGTSSMLPTVLKAFTQGALSTAGQVDITVTSASGSSFEAEAVDRLRAVDGIGAVSPVLRRSVVMPRGAGVTSVAVVGLDPSSARGVRSFPVDAGRMIADSDRGEIAIGRALADKLNLRVGSELALPGVEGMRSFQVIGILNTVGVPGTDEVLMTLPDAERLLAEGDRISEIEASLAEGADRVETETRARRVLGDQYVIGGISQGSELLASLNTGRFAISMFGVFALAMGGFIILNTFRTVVAERRRDIGMLRAVGAGRRLILGLFLVESLIQGIIGTLVGLAVGYAIAWGIVSAMQPIWGSVLNMDIGAPMFELSALVTAVSLGIGVTVLGALAPAFAAARITPLEALRPIVGDVEERQRGMRAWIGFGLLALSLALFFTRNTGLVGLGSVGVLVGLVLVAPELVAPISNVFGRIVDVIFKTEGEIARSNMQRQPSRAATTASAVMISLAIIIGLLGVMASIFSGFFTYIDKSVSGADYVMIPQNLILTQGNVGASNEFIGRVRAVPGITDVATLRVAKAKVDGDIAAQVIGIDPVDYPKIATFEFSEGATSDIKTLGEGRYIIANGVFAAQNGIRTGQVLRLTTPNGVKSYKVVAVGSDYLNAKLATLYVSQAALKADFGTEANVAVLASTEQPGGTPQIQRHLDLLVSDYPQMALYSTSEFREVQERTFQQAMIMFYSLIAILAIPSLLALLNNLAMSVIARTREIGMLRAVGSTRKQIRRMVLAESLLLASVGVVFGVASGVLLGYALVAAMNGVGFKMPYFFPTGGIVAAVIVGFGFAVLAALIPARHAAKLDVVTALHYE